MSEQESNARKIAPTPWKKTDVDIYDANDRMVVDGEYGSVDLTYEEQVEVTDRILAAVNAHTGLVAACRMALDYDTIEHGKFDRKYPSITNRRDVNAMLTTALAGLPSPLVEEVERLRAIISRAVNAIDEAYDGAQDSPTPELEKSLDELRSVAASKSPEGGGE